MGLKSSEAGKLGGINDFCIYPDINWIGKLTNVDGVQVDGGCAKCHVGLGAKPTAAPTKSQTSTAWSVRNRKIGNYLLSGRRLQRIVMALQTAREIRMAGRGALWIAGRVVTFEALFVSGNIRMVFRIPTN